MALTQYQPYGLPGKIRTFSAKSAAAAIAIHVFGTNPHLQAPNHAADNDDNVLVMGEIEARGGAAFGGESNYSKFDSDGNLTILGTAAGISPTAPAHFATQEYVDDTLGSTLDYYFNNTTSDISQETETTYVMNDLIEAGEETISKADITNASDQLLFVFATLSGEPGGINLAHGVYDAHVHLAITGGGARTVDVYWTLSSINDDGTNEVLIMTSETVAGITGGETEYTFHAILASDVTLAAASRLLFKFFGSGNSGNDATMVFYVEGTTGTHLTIKVPSAIFNTIYVRQDGTTPLTGPWDMGNQNLTNVDIDSGAIDAVTIGTNSPCTELQVDAININAGTILGDITLSLDAGEGGIRSNTVVGDTTATAANMFIESAAGPAIGQIFRSTSSARFKTIDSDMTTEKAGSILNLTPVKFFSECEGDDPDKVYYGLTAEDIAKNFPEAARYDSDGLPDSYDINFIVAALIKNQKELTKRIEALEKQ